MSNEHPQQKRGCEEMGMTSLNSDSESGAHRLVCANGTSEATPGNSEQRRRDDHMYLNEIGLPLTSPLIPNSWLSTWLSGLFVRLQGTGRVVDGCPGDALRGVCNAQ